MRTRANPMLSALFALGIVMSTPALAQSRNSPPSRPVPAAPAAADNSDVPAGKVEIQVMVVYATESHKKVDNRLGKLAGYLRNLRYTGYELLDTERSVLAPDGSDSFTIAGDRKVRVTLLSKDDRRARMRVEITNKKGSKLLDTTLSVNRNGTFIVAGPKYKDGILVLPLTARY